MKLKLNFFWVSQKQDMGIYNKIYISWRYTILFGDIFQYGV